MRFASGPSVVVGAIRIRVELGLLDDECVRGVGVAVTVGERRRRVQNDEVEEGERARGTRERRVRLLRAAKSISAAASTSAGAEPKTSSALSPYICHLTPPGALFLS